MRFGVEDLRDRALAALEEAAEQSTGGRRLERRSKAIAFALAYLCAYVCRDRAVGEADIFLGGVIDARMGGELFAGAEIVLGFVGQETA